MKVQLNIYFVFSALSLKIGAAWAAHWGFGEGGPRTACRTKTPKGAWFVVKGLYAGRCDLQLRTRPACLSPVYRGLLLDPGLPLQLLPESHRRRAASVWEDFTRTGEVSSSVTEWRSHICCVLDSCFTFEAWGSKCRLQPEVLSRRLQEHRGGGFRASGIGAPVDVPEAVCSFRWRIDLTSRLSRATSMMQKNRWQTEDAQLRTEAELGVEPSWPGPHAVLCKRRPRLLVHNEASMK